MTVYKRNVEDELLRILDQPEALFILGARQVGKTSLMKRIMAGLDRRNYLYFDLEHPDNLDLFDKGLNEFLAFLKYQNFTQKAYIFIDEVQYAKDFSGMIKYLVDHHSADYKLILSGSSSLQIKQHFKESLVGRKRLIELYPLTFSEFCLFKGEDKIASHLKDLNPFVLDMDPIRFERNKIIKLLQEYLIYGGFPKVVLSKNIKDKYAILKDIVDSYVLKDIRHIFKLEKVSEFNHLTKLLAAFSGKELNLSQLATETKLHKKTLEHYLKSLEHGYIVRTIQPFYSNLSSELRKTPKCYFLDTGLRNMLINNFNDLEFRSDRGELLETFVYTQLLKKAGESTKISYWKTKSKQEIDFILQEEKKLTAVEVKWNDGSQKYLKKFKQTYPDAETFVISLKQEFSRERTILPGYLS